MRKILILIPLGILSLLEIYLLLNNQGYTNITAPVINQSLISSPNPTPFYDLTIRCTKCLFCAGIC